LVPRAAAEALARLGNPAGVELLMQGLGDTNWSDRRAAAEALAQLASMCPAAIGKRWSEVRTLVTGPHYDQSSPARSCAESDWHGDSGIGVAFPDLPPGLEF
jgi:hypothetical protein